MLNDKSDFWQGGFFELLLAGLCFVLTLFGARFGFRWDEHYLALGGLVLAQGFVPYRDYSIPMGPIAIIFQSLGAFCFDSYFLKYAFSAALLNAGCFYVFLRFLRRANLDWLGKLGFSLVCVYSFFGAAGSVWYNQLAAMFVSGGVLLLLETSEKNSDWNLFLVAIFASLALLTKQDYGILGVGLLLGVLIVSKKSKLDVLMFTGTTLLLAFMGLWLFKFTYHVDVFSMVNTLNNGYPSRLSSLRYPEVWFRVFMNGNNLLRIWPFFLSAFGFLVLIRGDCRAKFYLKRELFIILSLVLISMTTLITSGKGAGFISIYFFPLVLACGLTAASSGNPKWINYIILAFGVYFSFINILDIQKIRDYVHPKSDYLAQFYYSKATADLFDRFNYLVESDTFPNRTVFLGGLFQFAHPKLKISFAGGPLWIHDGVTSKGSDLIQLVHNLKESKPDYIVDIWSDDDGMLVLRWGAAKDEYLMLLRSYEKKLEGLIDVIGSGGMTTKVTIYKLAT